MVADTPSLGLDFGILSVTKAKASAIATEAGSENLTVFLTVLVASLPLLSFFSLVGEESLVEDASALANRARRTRGVAVDASAR